MEPPKVFTSYSHDSDEHKEWVLKLSCKLRENGVDVMLDQWDVRLGTDQTFFMEKLSTADRVLMICTDTYVKKADNREGGVGYEGLIITDQIAADVKTDKFIPIIRQSSNERKMPIFWERGNILNSLMTTDLMKSSMNYFMTFMVYQSIESPRWERIH